MLTEPTAQAIEADGFGLCMKSLQATRAELADVQKVNGSQMEYGKLLKEQRDDAFKQLEKAGPLLPWYVWSILGAAGATILIRGVRQ